MTLPDPLRRVIDGDARWCVLDGDCRDVLSALPDRCIDHVFTDPPYSRKVHASVRSGGRRDLPDVRDHACRARRAVDLGFEHLRPELRRACARAFARVARRWVGVFSDVESCHLWRRSLESVGLDYVRTMEWRKLRGAPQFTGDRPASAFETITLAHPPGRKRWNGGGKAGAYTYPVVANCSGHRGDRTNEAQKPIGLALEWIEDFTDPGEIVADFFTGSGTTGEACVRLGRRFVGVELRPEQAATARERLAAAEAGSTLAAARAGQTALFGGAP